MMVQQFFVEGIAHSSYLLGGTDTCAIVDPRRDVQIYLDAAADLGMTITHVLETHLHADFVSGHMDLAAATGAQIHAPKRGNCAFDHVPVAEGDIFEIDELRLSVLETPGHTPEHVCYVVADQARGDQPVAVFAGDTLFVGDVGRPDLFPGKAKELASALYDSLREKLFKLPDFCEVYPAHGAGSLCGRAMGAKRTSTIGYERLLNSALQIDDRQEFIESLTSNMPPAPDHFSRSSAINAKGPTLVSELPVPRPLAPAAFRQESAADGTVVLDIRPYEAFGGQHVPGSWHVDFRGNFATFSAWLLPPDATILLVATDAEQVDDAVVWLRRVGLDNVAGFLAGGMLSWSSAGLGVGRVEQLSGDELAASIAGGEPLTLIDVRTPAEYGAGHIEGAVHIPMPDLRHRYAELDSDAPIATICRSGQRSSTASSILKQHGFTNVRNVAGGMLGYTAAGHAP